MDDYEDYDGLALAGLVKGRAVSAAELLQAALQRVERLNPQLNAIVTPLVDAARKSIARGVPNGAFEGVPFVVKELVASVAGAATTFRPRLYAENTAGDSDRRAPARPGSSSARLPGVRPVADHRVAPYGVTRNPWRTARTRRLERRLGRSGGGGMVPSRSHDGGGSIRIPASPGLFGLVDARASPPGPKAAGLTGWRCSM
jgi:amidase